MMNKFDFVQDENLKKYYEAIVQYMVSTIGISQSEAVIRVFEFAKTIKPTSGYLVLHRSIKYWAEGIYYRFDEKGAMTTDPKPIPPMS